MRENKLECLGLCRIRRMAVKIRIPNRRVIERFPCQEIDTAHSGGKTVIDAWVLFFFDNSLLIFNLSRLLRGAWECHISPRRGDVATLIPSLWHIQHLAWHIWCTCSISPYAIEMASVSTKYIIKLKYNPYAKVLVKQSKWPKVALVEACINVIILWLWRIFLAIFGHFWLYFRCFTKTFALFVYTSVRQT